MEFTLKPMPKTAWEMEKIICKDGWEYVGADGSHRHYRKPCLQRCRHGNIFHSYSIQENCPGHP